MFAFVHSINVDNYLKCLLETIEKCDEIVKNG